MYLFNTYYYKNLCKKKIILPTDSSTSTLCQLNSNNLNTSRAFSFF